MKSALGTEANVALTWKRYDTRNDEGRMMAYCMEDSVAMRGNSGTWDHARQFLISGLVACFHCDRLHTKVPP